MEELSGDGRAAELDEGDEELLLSRCCVGEKPTPFISRGWRGQSGESSGGVEVADSSSLLLSLLV